MSIITCPVIDEAKRKEAIIFATSIMYKYMNPASKMDIPSVAYEVMERKYDAWKEAQK